MGYRMYLLIRYIHCNAIIKIAVPSGVSNCNIVCNSGYAENSGKNDEIMPDTIINSMIDAIAPINNTHSISRGLSMI